jgi:hypothetical protein
MQPSTITMIMIVMIMMAMLMTDMMLMIDPTIY